MAHVSVRHGPLLCPKVRDRDRLPASSYGKEAIL
jgi:hypothetical protein